ncbi:calcium-binding protein [Leptolyngbya sp. O-77]|uniref:calcium-binding protein n=1 Tax=Leptolyngbya sp. O-77 TaxID=1080068 RepID=UPI00074D434C|nr:calcium-binding protein [Leptolyngbya sp. O-77]BAU43281.1 Bifunctional hemolysin/adenylate cyclase precursor [Leptolyngbya sp. O-77]
MVLNLDQIIRDRLIRLDSGLGENIPKTPFQEQTGSANPFAGIQSEVIAPKFVDIDGDGDADLLARTASGFKFFRNNGGKLQGVTGSSNPFRSLPLQAGDRPNFVDIDGDGDIDAFMGQRDGTIRFFRNDRGQFRQVTGAENPLNGIRVGNNSELIFADINNDGTPELFVTNSSGIRFIEKQRAVDDRNGDRSEPGGFEDMTNTNRNPLRSLSLRGAVQLAFGDLDGNGLIEMLVGDLSGRVSHFEFDFSSNAFVPVRNSHFTGLNFGSLANPEIGDIDGDGDLDVIMTSVVGTNRQMRLFSNTGQTAPPIRGTDANDILRGTLVNDLIDGGKGRDTISGLAGDDIIFAGDGNDVVNGDSGRDFLFGEDGNDTLRGGDGNDILTGSTFKNFQNGVPVNTDVDTLIGGKGSDHFRLPVDGARAIVQDFEDGIDRLSLFGRTRPLRFEDLDLRQQNKDVEIRLDGTLIGVLKNTDVNRITRDDFINPDRLGGDRIATPDPSTPPTNIGDRRGNVILGLEVGGIMDGRGGNDDLSGMGGDDILCGGNGHDTLRGGQGHDICWGGRGRDIYYGGAGRDTFVLDLLKGVDVIKDYKDGIDKIGLTNGITYEQISIQKEGKHSGIYLDDRKLGVVENTRPGTLRADDFKSISFVTVQDILTPQVTA